VNVLIPTRREPDSWGFPNQRHHDSRWQPQGLPWATLLRCGWTTRPRRFAGWQNGTAQARRLLAIAAILEGASRTEAARIGGMDRQTLRDWVIRFNDQGADGLIKIPSPGLPPKLNTMHRAFLARIV
jgi:hypothetical protein